MALSKFAIVIDRDETIKTVVSDYTGLLYKVLIHNANTEKNSFKIFIENSVTLYDKTLDSKETIELKPEIFLQSETLKIYSELKDLNVVIEFLSN